MEEAAARAIHLEKRWQLAPPETPTLDEILDRRDAA
jgi:hypothetical protein